ncbi:phospholipase A2 inhibitor [Onthophagus taurus]|uniref:phospholipase A2 inhibitor n=1 Tax=Onthophagus taurus TaxID=166361 RepID=UPI000C204FCE|nr:SLIT and NTRK-like protein 4 [Onthophagus taurus]XP_022905499.1 SLIT and NTRK-like protein 4 [Onthophagus taurus]
MKHKALLILLTLSIYHQIESKYVHNECRSKKLEKCYCGDTFYLERIYFLVNCTGQGFRDPSMLQELPPDTEALIFSGHNIETLPANIFGENMNLTKLKAIDMSNNRIKNIKGKTFHHIPNVELLILNHNEIIINDDYNDYDDTIYHHPRVFSNFINLQELHLTNAFKDNTDEQLANDLHDIFVKSNLTKLYKLHLEQNEIKRFKDDKVFCNLPSLKQLYLGTNDLQHINFDLKCLNLQFLDLENNKITQLSKKDLASFDRSGKSLTVDIRGNPLKCSQAADLYNWMNRTNVNIRYKEQLECDLKSTSGKRFVVNMKELAEVKHAKFSKAVTVLLVVLVLVLISLLGAYGYMHRDKIGMRMAPILDTVSRKVQYTTIDSQIV